MLAVVVGLVGSSANAQPVAPGGPRYEVAAASSDATSQMAARHLRKALVRAGARLATDGSPRGMALADALEQPTRWPITEAREALKRAREQLSEFRFEVTAQRLEDAEKLLLSMDARLADVERATGLVRADGSDPADLWASLLLWQARLAVARGDAPALARALWRFYVIRPAMQLSAAEYSPQVRAEHQKVVAAAARRPWSRLIVAASSWPAEVVVDGNRRAVAPAQFELVAGEHLLQLSQPGHKSVTRWITVPPGRPAMVAVPLPSLEPAEVLAQLVAEARARGGRPNPAWVDVGRAVQADRLLVVSGAVEGGARVESLDVKTGLAQPVGRVEGQVTAEQLATRLLAAGRAVEQVAHLDTYVAFPQEAETGPRGHWPKKWYKRWWPWTIVGAVVAGAVATAIVTRPSAAPSNRFFPVAY
jgi:hypothetical protein